LVPDASPHSAEGHFLRFLRQNRAGYKNRQKKSISVNPENLWGFELIFFVQTATISSRTQEEIASCA
jgi:hypothetical protein